MSRCTEQAVNTDKELAMTIDNAIDNGLDLMKS